MMRFLGFLALLATATAVGCGGGTKCADGCSRMKSCAEKLSCAGLDPMQQPQCNAVKKEFASVDCSPLDTYCPDQSRARFEQAATCTLDTTVTCQCR